MEPFAQSPAAACSSDSEESWSEIVQQQEEQLHQQQQQEQQNSLQPFLEGLHWASNAAFLGKSSDRSSTAVSSQQFGESRSSNNSVNGGSSSGREQTGGLVDAADCVDKERHGSTSARRRQNPQLHQLQVLLQQQQQRWLQHQHRLFHQQRWLPAQPSMQPQQAEEDSEESSSSDGDEVDGELESLFFGETSRGNRGKFKKASVAASLESRDAAGVALRSERAARPLPAFSETTRSTAHPPGGKTGLLTAADAALPLPPQSKPLVGDVSTTPAWGIPSENQAQVDSGLPCCNFPPHTTTGDFFYTWQQQVMLQQWHAAVWHMEQLLWVQQVLQVLLQQHQEVLLRQQQLWQQQQFQPQTADSSNSSSKSEALSLSIPKQQQQQQNELQRHLTSLLLFVCSSSEGSATSATTSSLPASGHDNNDSPPASTEKKTSEHASDQQQQLLLLQQQLERTGNDNRRDSSICSTVNTKPASALISPGLLATAATVQVQQQQALFLSNNSGAAAFGQQQEAQLRLRQPQHQHTSVRAAVVQQPFLVSPRAVVNSCQEERHRQHPQQFATASASDQIENLPAPAPLPGGPAVETATQSTNRGNMCATPIILPLPHWVCEAVAETSATVLQTAADDESAEAHGPEASVPCGWTAKERGQEETAVGVLDANGRACWAADVFISRAATLLEETPLKKTPPTTVINQGQVKVSSSPAQKTKSDTPPTPEGHFGWAMGTAEVEARAHVVEAAKKDAVVALVADLHKSGTGGLTAETAAAQEAATILKKAQAEELRRRSLGFGQEASAAFDDQWGLETSAGAEQGAFLNEGKRKDEGQESGSRASEFFRPLIASLASRIGARSNNAAASANLTSSSSSSRDRSALVEAYPCCCDCDIEVPIVEGAPSVQKRFSSSSSSSSTAEAAAAVRGRALPDDEGRQRGFSQSGLRQSQRRLFLQGQQELQRQQQAMGVVVGSVDSKSTNNSSSVGSWEKSKQVLSDELRALTQRYCGSASPQQPQQQRVTNSTVALAAEAEPSQIVGDTETFIISWGGARGNAEQGGQEQEALRLRQQQQQQHREKLLKLAQRNTGKPVCDVAAAEDDNLQLQQQTLQDGKLLLRQPYQTKTTDTFTKTESRTRPLVQVSADSLAQRQQNKKKQAQEQEFITPAWAEQQEPLTSGQQDVGESSSRVLGGGSERAFESAQLLAETETYRKDSNDVEIRNVPIEVFEEEKKGPLRFVRETDSDFFSADVAGSSLLLQSTREQPRQQDTEDNNRTSFLIHTRRRTEEDLNAAIWLQQQADQRTYCSTSLSADAQNAATSTTALATASSQAHTTYNNAGALAFPALASAAAPTPSADVLQRGQKAATKTNGRFSSLRALTVSSLSGQTQAWASLQAAVSRGVSAAACSAAAAASSSAAVLSAAANAAAEAAANVAAVGEEAVAALSVEQRVPNHTEVAAATRRRRAETVVKAPTSNTLMQRKLAFRAELVRTTGQQSPVNDITYTKNKQQLQTGELSEENEFFFPSSPTPPAVKEKHEDAQTCEWMTHISRNMRQKQAAAVESAQANAADADGNIGLRVEVGETLPIRQLAQAALAATTAADSSSSSNSSSSSSGAGSRRHSSSNSSRSSSGSSPRSPLSSKEKRVCDEELQRELQLQQKLLPRTDRSRMKDTHQQQELQRRSRAVVMHEQKQLMLQLQQQASYLSDVSESARSEEECSQEQVQQHRGRQMHGQQQVCEQQEQLRKQQQQQEESIHHVQPMLSMCEYGLNLLQKDQQLDTQAEQLPRQQQQLQPQKEGDSHLLQPQQLLQQPKMNLQDGVEQVGQLSDGGAKEHSEDHLHSVQQDDGRDSIITDQSEKQDANLRSQQIRLSACEEQLNTGAPEVVSEPVECIQKQFKHHQQQQRQTQASGKNKKVGQRQRKASKQETQLQPQQRVHQRLQQEQGKKTLHQQGQHQRRARQQQKEQLRQRQEVLRERQSDDEQKLSAGCSGPNG